MARAFRFRKIFISLHDLINPCCSEQPRPSLRLSRPKPKSAAMSDWGKSTILHLDHPCRSFALTIGAEGSGDDSPARPIPNKALATKNKWEGEDEDDDGPVVSPP